MKRFNRWARGLESWLTRYAPAASSVDWVCWELSARAYRVSRYMFRYKERGKPAFPTPS